MSMVGATKAYNVQPEYRRNNAMERKINNQFTMAMRACNGQPWTPALEDAVLANDMQSIRAILTLPNLRQL